MSSSATKGTQKNGRISHHYVAGEENIPDRLNCTVCHDIARTHRSCPGCRNIFCKDCVEQWFKTQRGNGQACSCPYCRKKLRFSNLQYRAEVQAELDALQVYCPNKSKGCPDILLRGFVEQHVSQTCLFSDVSCQFCGEIGLRQKVEQHETLECELRMVPCVHAADGCDALVPCKLMAEHLAFNCPKHLTTCPACGGAVVADSVQQHKDSCPSSAVCPNRIYGCEYEGTSDMITAHADSCMYVAKQQAVAGDMSGTDHLQQHSSTVRLVDQDESDVPCAPTVEDYHYMYHKCKKARLTLLKELSTTSGGTDLQQTIGGQLQVPATAAINREAAQSSSAAQQDQPAHVGFTGSFVAALQLAVPTDAAGSASSHQRHAGSHPALSAADSAGLGLPGSLVPFGLPDDRSVERMWRCMVNLKMFLHMTEPTSMPLYSIPSGDLYEGVLRTIQALPSSTKNALQNPMSRPSLLTRLLRTCRVLTALGDSTTETGRKREEGVSRVWGLEHGVTMINWSNPDAHHDFHNEVWEALMKLGLAHPVNSVGSHVVREVAKTWFDVAGCGGPEVTPEEASSMGEDVWAAVHQRQASAHRMHGNGPSKDMRKLAQQFEAADKDGIPPMLKLRKMVVDDPEALHAFEHITSQMLLDHFLALHTETTEIPSVNRYIHAGYRAYWAPGLVLGCLNWTPDVRLHWRTLAAMNDMVTMLGKKVLGHIAECFYNVDSERVALSAAAVMSTVQVRSVVFLC